MAKWEYAVISWSASPVSDEQRESLEKAGFQGRIEEAEGGAAIAQLGGVDYLGTDERDQIVDLRETVARLGDEGWELVTITPGPDATQFWFKREA
jgi:hypothetical protein